MFLLNRLSANDQIAVRGRRDEKSHVAEYASAIAVVPAQVDRFEWDVGISRHGGAALLFLGC